MPHRKLWSCHRPATIRELLTPLLVDLQEEVSQWRRLLTREDIRWLRRQMNEILDGELSRQCQITDPTLTTTQRALSDTNYTHAEVL